MSNIANSRVRGFAMVAFGDGMVAINHLNIDYPASDTDTSTSISLSGAWLFEDVAKRQIADLTTNRLIISSAGEKLPKDFKFQEVINLEDWALRGRTEAQRLSNLFQEYKSADKKRKSLVDPEWPRFDFDFKSLSLDSKPMERVIILSHLAKRCVDAWFELEVQRLKRKFLASDSQVLRITPPQQSELKGTLF